MKQALVLKAIADETRMNILKLLLQRNYCVRALARKIGISEAAVSQHLKVLREADLLVGEKKGYFMHYFVNRGVLHELAAGIKSLASIESQSCMPEHDVPRTSRFENCSKGGCMNEAKDCCRESQTHEGQQSHWCNHHKKSGE